MDCAPNVFQLLASAKDLTSVRQSVGTRVLVSGISVVYCIVLKTFVARISECQNVRSHRDNNDLKMIATVKERR